MKTIAVYMLALVVGSISLASSCDEKRAEEVLHSQEIPDSPGGEITEVLHDSLNVGQTKDGYTIGIVTVEQERNGCPWLIKTSIDGNRTMLYPVNLADEFKQDGLKIKFMYQVSRAHQGACTKADFPATFTNVSKF